jgi:hypothetical protein
MRFYVEQLAFNELSGIMRPVDIEDQEVAEKENQVLEQIFYHGQNDFQPQAGFYSASMGDVVHLNKKYFIIAGVGHKELTAEEYENYKIMTRDERQRFCWKF